VQDGPEYELMEQSGLINEEKNNSKALFLELVVNPLDGGGAKSSLYE